MSSKKISQSNLEPIDKTAFWIILLLSMAIGGLIFGAKLCGITGDVCFFHTGPRVKDFSWAGKQIGAEDAAFIITFDRPMARETVEQNLILKPPLQGKTSWAGRRLAYTLNTPAPYGETYTINLEGGREQFISKEGELMQPFKSHFTTRNRALAYIGSEDQELGRLIIFNLTKDQKTILTPPDLVVNDFKIYPEGEKILFSAATKTSGSDSLRELKLYTVTTGFNKPQTNPEIKLVLNNRDYQNNQFDLSADGKTIIVQRLNRQNPADFDLWAIKGDSQPQPLKIPGGDFLITPDGQNLAVAQGEGIAIAPLIPGAEVIDFLPKYGRILSFSPSGNGAAMVNFNRDNPDLLYTQSIYYVNNQGLQKEVLNINGSILDCKFNPAATSLFCLLTEIITGEEYQEKPFFAEIDLKTSKITPLVALPKYQDVEISMAPDGLGIVFDQVIPSATPDPENPLRTHLGEAVSNSQIWLLIPNSKSNTAELEQLPMNGFRPQWLP